MRNQTQPVTLAQVILAADRAGDKERVAILAAAACRRVSRETPPTPTGTQGYLKAARESAEQPRHASSVQRYRPDGIPIPRGTQGAIEDARRRTS